MNLQLIDSDDPIEIWPGHAEIDRGGVELAVAMFDEMCKATDDERIMVADVCSLDDWQREGLPFRNIVAEYLERARQGGPAALYAFTAVLSDLVSRAVEDNDESGERYVTKYGLDQDEEETDA